MLQAKWIRLSRPKLKPLLFTVAVSAVPTLIKQLLLPTLSFQTPFLIGLFPVFASALYGGFWMGILGLLLSAAMIDIFYLPPTPAFGFQQERIVPFLVFLVEGVAVASIIAQQKEAKAALATLNKNLEKTVQKRTQALISKNQLLQQSNADLEEFAYVASHDLQEPLRKIQAFGNLLSTEHGSALKEDGALYLDRILDSSKRMRTLIEGLLSYSRVSTKAEPFQAVDLNEVLSKVLSDLELSIAEVGAKIIAEKLPVIHAEPTQMQQLLLNLVSNTLKFHAKHEVPHITISCKRTTRTQDGVTKHYVQIQIKDTGVGFEMKYAGKIFLLFERLHGKSEYGGTGIGLAVCKKIVDRHGGIISVYSKPRSGTTVTVLLPEQKSTLKGAA